jgi:hypothetical protein
MDSLQDQAKGQIPFTFLNKLIKEYRISTLCYDEMRANTTFYCIKDLFYHIIDRIDGKSCL